MFPEILALLTLFTTLTAAHFAIDYPQWRGDSFADGASQWSWPCANISQTTSSQNRTAWPLTGGSLLLDVHHPWALTYVNLGVGNEVTSFNVSIVNHFNQTGNGTFCLSQVGRAQLEALGVREGTNATVQVVQIATSGASLYNCADITFSASAQTLGSDRCFNSTGVSGVAVENAEATNSSGGGASGTTTGAAAASTTGAASSVHGAPALLVAGAALLFGALL